MRAQTVTAMVEVERDILVLAVKDRLTNGCLRHPVPGKIPTQLGFYIDVDGSLAGLLCTQTKGAVPVSGQVGIQSQSVDVALVLRRAKARIAAGEL